MQHVLYLLGVVVAATCVATQQVRGELAPFAPLNVCVQPITQLVPTQSREEGPGHAKARTPRPRVTSVAVGRSRCVLFGLPALVI